MMTRTGILADGHNAREMRGRGCVHGVRSRTGFTLIELMVVVIIIAALAAMVLPRLLPAPNAAKMKIAKGELASIKVALDLYRLYHDRYPTTEEGADILMEVPKSKEWREPFLEKKPVDPWGQKYQYKCPGAHNTMAFDLWSIGPDGKDGTEDDVVNWQE